MPSSSEALFNQAFNDHQKTLRGYCWRQTNNRDLADDIAQETFVRLYENRRRVDFKSVLPWLYRAAGRQVVDYLRHTLAFRDIELLDEYSYPSHGNRIESDMYVKGLISRLPESYREILTLHIIDGLGPSEIVEVLGLPITTVSPKLRRALIALRRLVEAEA